MTKRADLARHANSLNRSTVPAIFGGLDRVLAFMIALAPIIVMISDLIQNTGRYHVERLYVAIPTDNGQLQHTSFEAKFGLFLQNSIIVVLVIDRPVALGRQAWLPMRLARLEFPGQESPFAYFTLDYPHGATRCPGNSHLYTVAELGAVSLRFD